MPVLTIPSPISTHLQGVTEIELDAHTLPSVVHELQEKHPKLYSMIFNSKGALSGFVNIYLNGARVSDQLNVNHLLKPSDQIEIVVSVSGG